jgi:hypothetical protein
LKNELDSLKQQTGGADPCMMPIFQEKNDPNIIEEEVIETKEPYKKPNYKKGNYETAPLNPEKDLLLDLQVFNPPQKPKSNFLEKKMSQVPHPVAVMAPYVPPQYSAYLGEVAKGYQQPFIYKEYNISLGPESNHTLANKIYTDALPVQSALIAYKSLKERNYLANHIRSTFIKSEEGELVSFTDRPNASLNATVDINCITNRLRLLELSPFNDNLFSKNPYDTMVQGLLIYRSCYPIEYDSKTGSTICSKNSTGVNVRIYALTSNDLTIFNPKNKDDLDIEMISINRQASIVWREISYYQFIRDEITTKFVCPNFIQSYCYFINEDVNLNFEKNSLISQVKKYTKFSIVLLTESPNDSLYSWVGNKYQKDFKNPSVNNMVKAGLKRDEDWKNILFQMMIIFYIFYEYNFIFTNIDVGKNFYIKNIKVVKDSSQYWIYNISGIEYFLPNNGYLLLFDTYYGNKSSGNFLEASFIDNDESDTKKITIRKIILNNVRKVFSINNFTDMLETMGGVKPSPEILILIQQISNELSTLTVLTDPANPNFNKNILEDVILKNFYFYLNNRIGTKLYAGEDVGIIGNTKINKKGDLIVTQDYIGTDGKFTYNIGLYDCNKDELECECITSLTPTLTRTELNKTDIYGLSSNDVIKQKFTATNPSVGSIENLIETYRLSKN